VINMSRLRYVASFFFPICAWLGFQWGGIWAWMSPLVAFGLVPLAELLTAGTEANLDDAGQAAARDARFYDWLLYALVALQWLLVLSFLYAVNTVEMSGLHLAGSVVSLGLCCGAFGINVGHELGHRPGRADQRLAVAALTSSLYVHFFVEHNRGHHAKVATAEDPATARKGETLYAFWLRSVRDSYRSAWRLERERLARKGRGWLAWGNLTLRHQLLQWGVVIALAAAFGLEAVGLFMAAAVLGFLMLETVNYVEHYGLTRAAKDDGRYERVRPVHSWNSNHPLGRVLLFEVTRHSDHHAHPGRRYPLLRHFDEAPQLPAGYPGMMLLSVVPPLFFRVMDPRVERALRTRQAA